MPHAAAERLPASFACPAGFCHPLPGWLQIAFEAEANDEMGAATISGSSVDGAARGMKRTAAEAVSESSGGDAAAEGGVANDDDGSGRGATAPKKKKSPSQRKSSNGRHNAREGAHRAAADGGSGA